MDGAAPPQAVLDEWLNIVDTRFRSGEGNTVAVHCVAGLGRFVLTRFDTVSG